MPNRVLCKFFANGACLKGERCEYSHEWEAPPNSICTFYQHGVCAYGSRCRYEHVEPSQSLELADLTSDISGAEELVFGTVTSGTGNGTAVGAEHSAYGGPFYLPSGPTWYGHYDALGSVDPAELPLCCFAVFGQCPRGLNCSRIHGDICPICGNESLHPYRPDQREAHMKACEKNQKHLEVLKRSEEIECGVCLELILSKSNGGARRFGILSECDHPFCIKCIRNWRGSAQLNVDAPHSTLRSCPICRKLSYFVIPSDFWYFSKEEKKEIVDKYKEQLRHINCKHFNFGNAKCPFGTSCFYKHTVKRGSILWIARHSPEFNSSRVQDINEVQSSSNVFEMNGLRTLLDLYNNPHHFPIENEELGDDNEEGLSDFMEDMMALVNAMRDQDGASDSTN